MTDPIEEIRERYCGVRLGSIQTAQAQEDVSTLLSEIDRLREALGEAREKMEGERKEPCECDFSDDFPPHICAYHTITEALKGGG